MNFLNTFIKRRTRLSLPVSPLFQITNTMINNALTKDDIKNSVRPELLRSIYQHIDASLEQSHQLTSLIMSTLGEYTYIMATYQVHDYLDKQANNTLNNPFNSNEIAQTYTKLSANGESIDEQLATVKNKWLPKLVAYLKRDALGQFHEKVADQVDANYQRILKHFDTDETKTAYLNYALLNNLKTELIQTNGITDFEEEIIDNVKSIDSLADLMWYLTFNLQLMNLHQSWYFRRSTKDHPSLVAQLMTLFVQRWKQQYPSNPHIELIREGTQLDGLQTGWKYLDYIQKLTTIQTENQIK